MSGRCDAPREDAMRGTKGARWSGRRCVREKGIRAGGSGSISEHALTVFVIDKIMIRPSYISGFRTAVQENAVFTHTHNVCGSLCCRADKGSDIYTQRTPQKPLFPAVCTALLHCSDSCAASRRFVAPLLLSITSLLTWRFNLAFAARLEPPNKRPTTSTAVDRALCCPHPQPFLPPV